MPSFRQWAGILALIVTGFLIVSCGPSAEDNARDIFENAKKLRTEGKELEALREFDRLVDFEETEVYKEAEELLRKDDISLGRAVYSWTIKKMFTMKNEMVAKGQLTHPDGDATVRLPQEDGWGNAYWINFSTSPKYYFVIVSAGPDGALKTPDDLTLFHRRPKQPGQDEETAEGGGEAKEPEKAPDRLPRNEPEKTPDRDEDRQAGDDRPSSRRPGETTVDLEDLLKAK